MTHTDPTPWNGHILRTPRGLSVGNTRITVYDILDYTRAGWPPHLIASWLNLPQDRVQAALAYIDAHKDAVEEEYHGVLREAEESRAYWESRNRGRITKAIDSEASGGDILRTRVREGREQLGL